MNIKHITLALLASVALAGSACQKGFDSEQSSEFVVSDNSALTFEQEGATKSITISAASSDWSIDHSSYDSWIKAVKEGKKIVITADPYEGLEERTTILNIVMGGSKRSFLISQFGSEPVLRLADDSGEVYFKKTAESRTLNIVSNTASWKTELMGTADWLTWEPSADGKNITLKVREFGRNEPNATTSRKAVLYLSNGTKHLRLDITQRGWAQFGMPFFKRGATRQEIIEEELKRGHNRSMDYERLLYPENEDSDKGYIAFSTDGEQTDLALYRFAWSAQDPFKNFENRAFLIAKKGETFNEGDLKAWFEDNKFKAAPPKHFEPWVSDFERYTRHYQEDDNTFKLFKVYNHARAYVPGGPYLSAVMEYTELPNDFVVQQSLYTGKMQAQNFPVRNAVRLHDTRYKLDDVIAYEQSKGMIPDYDHPFTIASSYPGVRYAVLVFKQQQTNTSPGQLIHVIYRFNYPGATDYDENGKPTNPATILSHDADLAGTVGSRQDIYQDPSLFYDTRFGTTTLSISARGYADEKGYNLVRSDESGFTTLVRGEDELVDITAGENWFTFNFYKSKELVALVNKK